MRRLRIVARAQLSLYPDTAEPAAAPVWASLPEAARVRALVALAAVIARAAGVAAGPADDGAEAAPDTGSRARR